MEKSFWDEVRAGRYRNEAEAMREAMRSRARRILNSKPPRGLQPVVVKQVSTARPVEALRRVARYIARLDVDYERPEKQTGTASKEREQAVAAERNPPPVFDEQGIQVANHSVLERIAEWGLIRDEDNLSDAGRALFDRVEEREGRTHRGGWNTVRQANEDEVFDEIQGRHIVISVPVGKERRKAFEEIARETVVRTFGAWGFPALVAVHVEHGTEMHAHILFGTTRDLANDLDSIDARPRRRTDRFVLDMHGIMADTLRQTLVDVADKYGFPGLDMTRREDRGDLVSQALGGLIDLRPPAPRRSFDEALFRQDDRRKQTPEERAYVERLESLPPMMRRLVRRAPLFVIENAEAIARRLEAIEKARGQRSSEVATNPELKARLRARRKSGAQADDWSPFPRASFDREPPAHNAPSALLQRLTEAIGIGRSAPVGSEPEIVNEVHRMLRARRVFETASGEDRSAVAIAGWQAMRGEDLRFADWALVNAPWVFGDVTAEASRLPFDEEIDAALRALTDADSEIGDEVRRKRLAEQSPAALAQLMRRAVDESLSGIREAPGALGAERLARKAQRIIVRSYVTLADQIEMAFDGDAEMIESARKIRDKAADIEELTPLPYTGEAGLGGRVAERMPDRDRGRPDRTRDGGRDR